MNCKKCGKQIPGDIDCCTDCKDEDEKKTEIEAAKTVVVICPQCNTPINVEITGGTKTTPVKSEPTPTQSEPTPVKSEHSKIYIIIFSVSLALFFLIGGIGLLIALVTIITGKINCPQSRAIKILFWLYLAAIAAYAIFIMVIMAICFGSASATINSCIGYR